MNKCNVLCKIISEYKLVSPRRNQRRLAIGTIGCQPVKAAWSRWGGSASFALGSAECVSAHPSQGADSTPKSSPSQWVFLPDLGFWGCWAASISPCFPTGLHAQARVAPGQRTAAGTLWACPNGAEWRQDEGSVCGQREKTKVGKRKEKHF